MMHLRKSDEFIGFPIEIKLWGWNFIELKMHLERVCALFLMLSELDI